MNSVSAIVGLYVKGGEYQAQALELSKSLGGEIGRLMWEFHRTCEIIDEVYDLRDKIEAQWTLFESDPTTPLIPCDQWLALLGLLNHGIEHWDDRSLEIAKAIGVLERDLC